MKSLALLSSPLLLLLGAIPAQAQAPGAADQRLREQIKALTGQLRAAETEKATLQADKTATDEKVKKLEKSFEELTKQMAADKDTATKEREKLAGELSAKETELTETKGLLVKADAFGKQNADLAKKTEAERAKLAAANIQLKDTVANQRAKNRQMFEIASEILTRYSKFGLGTALTAREPFVGITRARLETMVEEYGGQLDAQRIRIDGTSPKPTSGATPAGQERPADGKPSEKKKATKP